MKSPTKMEDLAIEIADSMENIESPFYSDITMRVKDKYSDQSKRTLLFMKVCDLLKKKGKRIWS